MIKNQSRSLINKILVISVFIIYPLGSVPLILVDIYNKRKYAFILLAIFMGLWAMLYYPFGDQYRYFNNFERYFYLDFNEAFLFNIASEFSLYTINLIDYFLFEYSKAGLHFEGFRFLLVFIAYLLTFHVHWNIDSEYFLSKRNLFICLLYSFY